MGRKYSSSGRGFIAVDFGGGGGGTSNYNDLSNKPQINGVTLTGNKTSSDLGLNIPVLDASTPPASMDSNKVYQYGTLAGDTTFPPLATPADVNIANVYCWTFSTPPTAPTITWPAEITAWAGGNAPIINASKSYEVSVMDGIATIIEA